MNGVTITEENFNLKDSLISSTVLPDSNIDANITVANQHLTLSFSTERISDITNCFLVAYDKKQKAVISLQEVSQICDDMISCDVSEDFINTLANTENFKYARICLAAYTGTTLYYSFIKGSPDATLADSDNYIGTLATTTYNDVSNDAIAYLSSGGLLSVKFVSTEDTTNYPIKGFVDSLDMNNNILTIQVSFTKKLDKIPELAWISRTTNCNNEGLPFIVQTDNSTKQSKFLYSCNFSEVSIEDFDGYILSCFYDNEAIDITFSNLSSETSTLDKVYKVSAVNDFNVAFACNSDMCLDMQIAEYIYDYIFSIVMAVYNTEPFLAEALDSILAQDTASLNNYTIGNKSSNYKGRVYKNIFQVITVDDGATDSSGLICDQYASNYKNFTVVHKENGGVSTARNAGIELATGKYINFMDSDDKLSNNVFKECFKFFEANYDKTDIITFPPKIFDARTGEHWLNEKFSSDDRVINLLKEYDKNVLLVNASFFKTEKIKGKIKFEENLKIAEDVRFIYTLYFNETPRFGTVSKCTYWYRSRSMGEKSLIQECKNSRNYYIEFFDDCILWLLSESKKRYGFVPQYIQYLVAQQIQWRFKEDNDASLAKAALSEDEFEQYVQKIITALKDIDTRMILEQKKIFREQKKYILELKSGKPLDKFFDGNDIIYFSDSLQIAEASTNYVRLEFLKFKNDSLYLEGYNMSFEDNSEIYIKVNDEFISPNTYSRDVNVYALGHAVFHGKPFQYTINLDSRIPNQTISFYEKIDGHLIQKRDIRLAKTMPISKTFSKSYYAYDGWVARLDNANLSIRKPKDSYDARSFYTNYEKQFIEQVEKKVKTQTEKNALALRKEVMPTLAYYKMYNHKKIWLISDRVNMAGDNGEAFFLYMLKQNNPDIDLYFVINDTSPDYSRLKELGNVVVQNSKQHKILHFLAEYVISSQGNEYIINPFVHEGTTDIFRDIVYQPKFVFLQHGVIKDDLSGWLNRFNKDMTGFVTAATPEYQSILDYDYYYTKKEVWLTGLPRHDRLYHDEKNYVTIMPTWRKYLSAASPEDPEITVVKDNFEESDFFKFYNLLINNERLINAAREYGYTVCFMPHPNIMNNLHMFDHHPEVKFFGTEKPYREIYAESNLVMTDYSSSIMDFAYMRKPIVYCHFDHEDFFAGDHVYVRGYFEYERDGFGEVTYDIDSLVDVFIEYMKNNCKLKDIYKQRMDSFFTYSDTNNCERLYKRLLLDSSEK